jgi:hypothetical protein
MAPPGVASPSLIVITEAPATRIPGATYTWELHFSDRIPGEDFNRVNQLLGFDARTDGAFTTAATIREPSTWAMMLIGFGGLGYAARRRRRGKLSLG